jgi:hypothetical protein
MMRTDIVDKTSSVIMRAVRLARPAVLLRFFVFRLKADASATAGSREN